MSKKENRPDACSASGTAPYTCDYDSTVMHPGQDSIVKSIADFVAEYATLDGFADECRAQCITYDDVLKGATMMYLSEIDRDDPPFRGQLKHELLEAANICIAAYNTGKRDELAPPGASEKDAYPDKKHAGECYRRLNELHPLQIALVVRELHHAKGVLWKDAGNDGSTSASIRPRGTTGAHTSRARTAWRGSSAATITRLRCAASMKPRQSCVQSARSSSRTRTPTWSP